MLTFAPTANLHKKFYENVFAVLKTSAELLAMAPETNIFPSEDPAAPLPGNIVVYSIQGYKWDAVKRRADFVFTINTESIENKVSATDMMTLIKQVLNARALTSNGIAVGLFREQTGQVDNLITPTKRIASQQSYDVKLVER